MLFGSDNQAGVPVPAGGRASVRGQIDTDAHLIEAARALDERAWEEIYQRHARQVYAYIFYRLGDQHIAEDLTADVFVRALAGIRGYAWRGSPLLGWLYRIAHNVTVDHRKSAAKHSRHRATPDTEDLEERCDQLRLHDERADMMQVIRALTEDQQQVIILRFYQGLSAAEVSRVMGRPEGAVKALQSRGLRSLRRMLDERRVSA